MIEEDELEEDETWTPLEFPPQIRWGVRRGASIAERPKGPNGKRLCGWCDNQLPKYRRSWCSDACAGKFMRVWSWGALRTYIIGRDRTCRRCGSDHPGWETTHPYEARDLDGTGKHCRLERAAWNVDHILPVQDGGTDDPANLRLLCKRCHIAVGYEQRDAQRAAVRAMQIRALEAGGDFVAAMKVRRFPPELAGVMVLLEDHDLVQHPRDFRCPFEAPHKAEYCRKVRHLPKLPP